MEGVTREYSPFLHVHSGSTVGAGGSTASLMVAVVPLALAVVPLALPLLAVDGGVAVVLG